MTRALDSKRCTYTSPAAGPSGSSPAAGPSGSSPAAGPSDSSCSNKCPPADIGSGLADKRVFLFDPATQMGMGLDPGAIQAARRNTQRNDNIKLELQHLAAATPTGTSLVVIQRHVAVTQATWDAETVLERYFMKVPCPFKDVMRFVCILCALQLEEEAAMVSQQRWGTRKQLVVFSGNAGIGTRGGWGAKAVLQACRKVVERPNSGKPTDRLPGKVVTVDEFCTSRVSSAMNSPQPCEGGLDRSKPLGLKAGSQVQHRLLRSAWSKRFEAPVRGLMWCPKLDQATREWVDRDCNAAVNNQRAGESKWRPLELCKWQQQGAAAAQGKEYPALGFNKLRDRALKAQAQQPVAQTTPLGYKRLRDKPPKAQQQQQQQQPAEAHEHPLILRQQKEVCKYVAKPNYLTVHKRLKHHPIFKPVLGYPSNRDLLAKLDQWVIKVPGGAVLSGCKKTRRTILAHFQLRVETYSQLRVIASLFVLRIFLTCLVGHPTQGLGLATEPPAMQPPCAPDAAPLPPLPLRAPAQPAMMDWDLVAPAKPPQAPGSSQEATQPAASEPGPSTPPPAKRSKRTKAEKAAEAHPAHPGQGQGCQSQTSPTARQVAGQGLQCSAEHAAHWGEQVAAAGAVLLARTGSAAS
ncbi:hypothetical protein QJQ45_006726 [Haematococcus lacustris]|nr:hypothetical protein QJQ45_006726 [Haematococcus lacustris]